MYKETLRKVVSEKIYIEKYINKECEQSFSSKFRSYSSQLRKKLLNSF